MRFLGFGSCVYCSPRLIILIDCEIALKEVLLTPGVVAHKSVDRESNAIPVHSITAGSAKLSDWLIREGEETLENNIRSS